MPGSTAGPSVYYPTDDSRGKPGLVPLHPCPFEAFRAKSARCGVCYLHRLSCIKFGSLSARQGMLFGMSFPQQAPNKHESSGVPYCFKREIFKHPRFEFWEHLSSSLWSVFLLGTYNELELQPLHIHYHLNSLARANRSSRSI